MKKIISVLLAIVMIFSLVTVAFAAEGETNPDQTTTTEAAPTEETSGEETTGSFNIEEMPLWQLKLILKGGKIVLKIAKVLFKIASALGLVDTTDILRTIIDFILESQEGNNEEPSTDPSQVTSSQTAEEPVAA